MNKPYNWQVTLLIIHFLLVSCTSDKPKKPDLINDTFPKAQTELREVVNSIVNDVMSANIEGLHASHLASDKFTK